ncbi:hypothetical protein NP493_126g03008 [Ridgeia piscesae]|uniref:Secreted protein n=1 Tax=Ridgeia piscesae TaxID=27915 RepID=A0AAD9UGI4_RIDPI|nr:hypothetical protein NP493_126g03008 [Ridgeia piscesae]
MKLAVFGLLLLAASAVRACRPRGDPRKNGVHELGSCDVYSGVFSLKKRRRVRVDECPGDALGAVTEATYAETTDGWMSPTA